MIYSFPSILSCMPHRTTTPIPFLATQSNFLRFSEPVRFLQNIPRYDHPPRYVIKRTSKEISAPAHTTLELILFFVRLLAECGGSHQGPYPSVRIVLGVTLPGAPRTGIKRLMLHCYRTWVPAGTYHQICSTPTFFAWKCATPITGIIWVMVTIPRWDSLLLVGTSNSH
jgi:hypothetical protein